MNIADIARQALAPIKSAWPKVKHIICLLFGEFKIAAFVTALVVSPLLIIALAVHAYITQSSPHHVSCLHDGTFLIVGVFGRIDEHYMSDKLTLSDPICIIKNNTGFIFTAESWMSEYRPVCIIRRAQPDDCPGDPQTATGASASEQANR